jgi:hypothetical protein
MGHWSAAPRKTKKKKKKKKKRRLSPEQKEKALEKLALRGISSLGQGCQRQARTM